jgi:hypothetical protein
MVTTGWPGNTYRGHSAGRQTYAQFSHAMKIPAQLPHFTQS